MSTWRISRLAWKVAWWIARSAYRLAWDGRTCRIARSAYWLAWDGRTCRLAWDRIAGWSCWLAGRRYRLASNWIAGWGCWLVRITGRSRCCSRLVLTRWWLRICLVVLLLKWLLGLSRWILLLYCVLFRHVGHKKKNLSITATKSKRCDIDTSLVVIVYVCGHTRYVIRTVLVQYSTVQLASYS